jgi:hypothetical protein
MTLDNRFNEILADEDSVHSEETLPAINEKGVRWTVMAKVPLTALSDEKF